MFLILYFIFSFHFLSCCQGWLQRWYLNHCQNLVRQKVSCKCSQERAAHLEHLWDLHIYFYPRFFFSLTSHQCHQWPTSDSPTHAASLHPVKHPDVQRWLWESPPGCGCRLQKLCCAHWQSMVKFMTLWRSKWCLGCFWEVKTEHCMGYPNRRENILYNCLLSELSVQAGKHMQA